MHLCAGSTHEEAEQADKVGCLGDAPDKQVLVETL